jgi:putative tryptophan/tyrosine transport system substrate-binding protein
MRRIGLAVVLAVSVTLAPFATEAQPAAKAARIGILDPGIPHLFTAFRQALRDLGYVEGQNVVFDVRSASGRLDTIPTLARDLVRSNPDLIVSASTLPLQSLKRETTTIPIVAAAIGDAVGAGLVVSLPRPGGNLTGLSFLNTELSGKRLEVLLEALPGLRRVAMLNDPTTSQLDLAATASAARQLHVQLLRFDVRDVEEFERAFLAARRGGAEAIDVLASAFFNANRKQIVDLAARNRLPAIYESREYAEAGGLLTYGQDLTDLFRRAATYVDKILKGAKPADLPVEQPTKFELVINLKTAKALGLTIPQTLLQRADEIIQ